MKMSHHNGQPNTNSTSEVSSQRGSVKLSRAALVAGLAVAGVIGLRSLNETPTTSHAEIELLSKKEVPQMQGVLVIKPGINIRTTPERDTSDWGANDPIAIKGKSNIADLEVPKGKSIVVANPYIKDGFLGFTVTDDGEANKGTVAVVESDGSKDEAEALAKKTYWIDYETLQKLDDLRVDFTPGKTLGADVAIDAPAVASFVANSEIEKVVADLQSGLQKPSA